MINDDSLRALDGAQWTSHFIKPLYESYCFAQIPGLIRSLFGGDSTDVPARMLGPLFGRYDTVILFFIDGFGWRFVSKYYDKYPFLQRFARDGMVCKLTSQFPSTTAAHVTTIHTGLPVGQSGVYEWFYYEPQLDAVISPLYYSFAGDKHRHTLEQTGISPQALFPPRTLYQDLRQLGVESHVFQYRDYTPSPFTDTVTRGAHMVPYATLPEALGTLADLLRGQQERSYVTLYFDKVDSTGHHYGPTSPHVEAEIERCLAVLEQDFHQRVAGTLKKTLVLITADHGQIGIDPATTIYLNLQWPDITKYLKTNRAGHLIAPAGSPRDMFLHIKDEYRDEAYAYLRDFLTGRAEVYDVADLIEQGFFGAEEPSPTFLGRVGDLVILPYAHESVWWYEQGQFEQGYYGHHGGLTREEMETVLLALPYT